MTMLWTILFASVWVALNISIAWSQSDERDRLPHEFEMAFDLDTVQVSKIAAMTYDWDTQKLFVLANEGDMLLKVTKTGEIENAMTLTGFDTTQALTYIGESKLVLVEEGEDRMQRIYLLEYMPGTTILRGSLATLSVSDEIGNLGSIIFDQHTGFYFIMTANDPPDLFQVNIDFESGQIEVENRVTLRDLILPAIRGIRSIVPHPERLEAPLDEDLWFVHQSQESSIIVSVTRTGEIVSQIHPSSLSDTMQAVTIDEQRQLYLADQIQPRIFLLVRRSPRAPSMKITEYMYSGQPGEFVELTNISNGSVNLSGWRFVNESESPRWVDLSGLGMVESGKRVILTEANEGEFREEWQLPDPEQVKILPALSNHLGRNDKIKIYDGQNQLVDQLIYGDERYPGTIHTENISGNRTAGLGFGSSAIFSWVLSQPDDRFGSIVTEFNALVGNPGLFNCQVSSNTQTVVPELKLPKHFHSIEARDGNIGEWISPAFFIDCNPTGRILRVTGNFYGNSDSGRGTDALQFWAVGPEFPNGSQLIEGTSIPDTGFASGTFNKLIAIPQGIEWVKIRITSDFTRGSSEWCVAIVEPSRCLPPLMGNQHCSCDRQ